jgi:hypothetical protein
VKALSNFSYRLVQGLVKSLEIHRKILKIPNQFCRVQDAKPHLLVVHSWLDSNWFWQEKYKCVIHGSVLT